MAPTQGLMTVDRRSSLTSDSRHVGSFLCEVIEQTAPGSDAGGDVLLFENDGDDGLRFLIADMAGSGAQGNNAWRSVEPAVLRAWSDFVAADYTPLTLRSLGEKANAAAVALDTSLCLSAGRIAVEQMTWATWGYGVHVLPSSSGEPWPMPPHDEAFGLKLGWLADSDFRDMAGSFVLNEWRAPTRVVMFTDGILGDDHASPAATWEWLLETNRLGATFPADALLEWLIDRSEIRYDDITIAVIAVDDRRAEAATGSL